MTIASQKSIVDRIDPQLGWLVGNARLIGFSGQLLGAHLAHAGLILFWAGSTTVSEVLRYRMDLPFAEQDFIVLPHLAMLGWGIGADGNIIDTAPYFMIGMLHLISSAVVAAGGLYHVVRAPASLHTGSQLVRNFHYEWNDARQLGLILGHHLIFLGLGALALVLKAMYWGGIYDPKLHQVRIITEPTVDPATIFGYLAGFSHGSWSWLGLASVDNLEDVIGGHIWVAGMLIIGGIWHILMPPFAVVTKRISIDADAILSYSLASLAFMAILSCVFVSKNYTVFPVEFYGEDRLTATGIQFGLGATALGGHLWHANRSKQQRRERS
jgi:photosystem II CP43 chlorophyll apoprotein